MTLERSISKEAENQVLYSIAGDSSSHHSQAGQDTTRTPRKSIRISAFGTGSRRTAPTSVRRVMASAGSHEAFRWNLFWSAACGCMLFCNVMFDLLKCDWVSVLLGSAAKAGATPWCMNSRLSYAHLRDTKSRWS